VRASRLSAGNGSTTATVARIKTEFDRLIARYAADEGRVVLPVVAILGDGTR
jgi:hypothetical protein